LEARVTLDLARPEHREALRWACGVNEPIDMSTVVTALQAWCMRAIHQPTESAAIVRALLQRCGISAHDKSSDDQEDDAIDVWSYVDGVWYQFPETRTETFSTARVLIAKVPALILALLVCMDRDGALAALKGAA
jgi:hypothetical protein